MTGARPFSAMPAAAACPLDIDLAIEEPRWAALLPDPSQGGPEAGLVPVIRAALAAGGAPDLAPGRRAELSLVLGDDALSRRLNRDYRGIDKPTNVLSFPMIDPEMIDPESADAGERTGDGDAGQGDAAAPPVLLGDLVLAYETVLSEAESQDKRPIDHLCHLLVHGVLHLIGYDHGSDAEAETMERLEADVLARFGIPDPYRPSEPPTPPNESK